MLIHVNPRTHNHMRLPHPGRIRWAVVALIVAVQLAACSPALAAGAGAGIVVGRGIDGVQLLQTKTQVKSRLGAFPCNCYRTVWSYVDVGYASNTSPVAGVDFTRGGLVNEVFAFGSRRKNHLLTTRGVGLGSAITSVQRAYKNAGCALVLAPKTKPGPPSGLCAIVTRLGASDADTEFDAPDDGATAGSVNEVSVYLLAPASAETIKLSVARQPVTISQRLSAKLAVAVESPPFFDFPNGLGIAGDHLRLSITGKGERIGRVTDRGNGTYTATITSPGSVGVVTLSATDGAASAKLKLSRAKL